jgi:hypothetical protein
MFLNEGIKEAVERGAGGPEREGIKEEIEFQFKCKRKEERRHRTSLTGATSPWRDER